MYRVCVRTSVLLRACVLLVIQRNVKLCVKTEHSTSQGSQLCHANKHLLPILTSYLVQPASTLYTSSFAPYSYHNIDPSLRYPPLLMTTSTRDDRVHPYHARSFVKRLEEVGNCDELHYYENIEGGHRDIWNSFPTIISEQLNQ